MSRIRMVTRTVSVTTVTVMCVTVSTATVSSQMYTLSGVFDNVTALAMVKKQYETDDFKPTAITKLDTSELLYGMSEAEFIKLAKILPPRGTIATE